MELHRPRLTFSEYDTRFVFFLLGCHTTRFLEIFVVENRKANSDMCVYVSFQAKRKE